MPAAATPWPTEIRVTKAKDTLIVGFDDGSLFELSAEMLRVMSPSAEVQGHSREQRVLLGGKKDVKIIGVEPVGNYAVRLRFDDRHDTGLFTWGYLHKLGAEQRALWTAYLDELKAAGKSR